jgi:hypothetical protein
MEKNWGVNDKLLKTLEKQVKKIVAEEAVGNAMDVLSRCTDETIREFLHFAFLENYNIACTCLDFAIDKNTGKPIKNSTFGHTLSKETLDELFEAHDPEDFIDEDDEDWERASLEDYKDEKDKEVLIELEEWDHRCGDGFSYNKGVDIFVNGEQIEDEDGSNPHQLLKAVLNKLGYTNVLVNYK